MRSPKKCAVCHTAVSVPTRGGTTGCIVRSQVLRVGSSSAGSLGNSAVRRRQTISTNTNASMSTGKSDTSEQTTTKIIRTELLARHHQRRPSTISSRTQVEYLSYIADSLVYSLHTYVWVNSHLTRQTRHPSCRATRCTDRRRREHAPPPVRSCHVMSCHGQCRPGNAGRYVSSYHRGSIRLENETITTSTFFL